MDQVSRATQRLLARYVLQRVEARLRSKTNDVSVIGLGAAFEAWLAFEARLALEGDHRGLRRAAGVQGGAPISTINEWKKVDLSVWSAVEPIAWRSNPNSFTTTRTGVRSATTSVTISTRKGQSSAWLGGSVAGDCWPSVEAFHHERQRNISRRSDASFYEWHRQVFEHLNESSRCSSRAVGSPNVCSAAPMVRSKGSAWHDARCDHAHQRCVAKHLPVSIDRSPRLATGLKLQGIPAGSRHTRCDGIRACHTSHAAGSTKSCDTFQELVRLTL